MTGTKQFLEQILHRPWPLPRRSFIFYQEWHNVIFLHFPFEASPIEPLLPQELLLDTFESKAWISLVAFTVDNLRPKLLPPMPFLSKFNEVNVRTYVTIKSKPGIFFLDIHADKTLSLQLAKFASGLRYQKAKIVCKNRNYELTTKNYSFNIHYSPQQEIKRKTGFDAWITERYCVYFCKNKSLYRYQIHHPEWKLTNIDLDTVKLLYNRN